MEFFDTAKKVRLLNCHGKYLWANDDRRTVSQSKRGDRENAVWKVKRFEDDDKFVIRLKSCYDCYLTGSNTAFLLGMTGKKVFQTNPTKSDDLCQWQPIRYGSLVKLKTRDESFLRANAGAPPWRNSVTHDIPLVPGTFDVLWAVEIIE